MNLFVHTPAFPATEDERHTKIWLVQMITEALLENQRKRRNFKLAELRQSVVR